jgi:hypothetical protein
MNCSRCGAYYGPTQRYCTGCGRDILAAKEQASQPAYVPAPSSGAPYPALEGEVLVPGASAPGDPYRSAYVPIPSPAPTCRSSRSGAGTIGAGAVGLLALLSKLKGLLVLLKLGKFTGTLITMLISVGAYAAFFGLPFAAGPSSCCSCTRWATGWSCAPRASPRARRSSSPSWVR